MLDMNRSLKLKLLYYPSNCATLNCAYLEPLWNLYFEKIALDPEVEYSQDHLIFLDFATADNLIHTWQDRGYKIIIDHLWDGWRSDRWITTDTQLVLRNTKWFWHNESLWFKSLGYHKFVRTNTIDKSFLLLMNMPRPHRKQLYTKLKTILDHDSIYSFHGIGIPLQNGSDKFKTSPAGDRYTDIDWYNRTKFSVVVETGTEEFEYSSIRNGDPWIIHTEKSYKPFAFKHPWVTWGSAGTLNFLKSQGFETFDHAIDESYDNIKDHYHRLDKIVAVINELNQIVKHDAYYFFDTQSQEKLEHNYNLFYDTDLAYKFFEEEIVNPIYEFANK